MIRLLIVINTIIILIGCESKMKGQSIPNSCLEYNKAAVDSVAFYQSARNKRRSTLENALALVNKAISCHDKFVAPRSNKITILKSLGRIDEAISVTNDLFTLNQDSSLFLIKGDLYSNLKNKNEALSNYREAFKYFNGQVEKKPHDNYLIYNMLLTKSYVFGVESIKNDIEKYRKEFPDNVELNHLLDFFADN